ncbi:MAG: polysaccharide lyase family 7 protein [Deltaproteobacteria bacterium]|nr:polysaccharide lyase family 7 protein [Nannocystaceae bacterium]
MTTTPDESSENSIGTDTGIATSEPDGSTTQADSTDSGTTTDGGPVATVPAELLDLSAWKLTLPVGSRRAPDEPREVLQPELASFTLDPFFALTDTADGVVFQANAGGVTTDNSGYPRSELREMLPDGSDEAAWTTTAGTHTLTITQAITHLPIEKPHVVAGQIHDADDDVVMIRLEGERLFVEGDGDELGLLDDAYVLGTVFTVQMSAHDGIIDVYYEDLGDPLVSLARAAEGCYFKAGVYTQSNEEQGDTPDAYGEVVIHELVLEHG